MGRIKCGSGDGGEPARSSLGQRAFAGRMSIFVGIIKWGVSMEDALARPLEEPLFPGRETHRIFEVNGNSQLVDTRRRCQRAIQANEVSY